MLTKKFILIRLRNILIIKCVLLTLPLPTNTRHNTIYTNERLTWMYEHRQANKTIHFCGLSVIILLLLWERVLRLAYITNETLLVRTQHESCKGVRFVLLVDRNFLYGLRGLTLPLQAAMFLKIPNTFWPLTKISTD